MNISVIFLITIFTAFLFVVLGFLVYFFHNLKKLYYIPKTVFLFKNILIILIFLISIFTYFWIITGEDVIFKNASFDISRDTRLDF